MNNPPSNPTDFPANPATHPNGPGGVSPCGLESTLLAHHALARSRRGGLTHAPWHDQICCAWIAAGRWVAAVEPVEQLGASAHERIEAEALAAAAAAALAEELHAVAPPHALAPAHPGVIARVDGRQRAAEPIEWRLLLGAHQPHLRVPESWAHYVDGLDEGQREHLDELAHAKMCSPTPNLIDPCWASPWFGRAHFLPALRAATVETQRCADFLAPLSQHGEWVAAARVLGAVARPASFDVTAGRPTDLHLSKIRSDAPSMEAAAAAALALTRCAAAARFLPPLDPNAVELVSLLIPASACATLGQTLAGQMAG